LEPVDQLHDPVVLLRRCGRADAGLGGNDEADEYGGANSHHHSDLRVIRHPKSMSNADRRYRQPPRHECEMTDATGTNQGASAGRFRINTVRSSVNRESRACASTARKIPGASCAGDSGAWAARKRSSPLSSKG